MRHRINKANPIEQLGIDRKYNAMAIGAMSCLALLMWGLIMPSCTKGADAIEGAGDVGNNAGVDAQTIIIPSVSLGLESDAEMNITPTSQGTMGKVSAVMTVGTTNKVGYSIYVNTADVTTAMTSTDTVRQAKIETTAEARTLVELESNHWGFSLEKLSGSGEVNMNGVGTERHIAAVNEEALYYPMTLTSAKVAESTRATTLDQYALSFGAKIDTSLPAGQYANNVQVSVVANPQVIRTLSELTYMQEMSTLTCENSAEHETKQLIDSRDGKSYWVAKLRDGNCWMTQNLALDLEEGEVLTSAGVGSD